MASHKAYCNILKGTRKARQTLITPLLFNITTKKQSRARGFAENYIHETRIENLPLLGAMCEPVGCRVPLKKLLLC